MCNWPWMLQHMALLSEALRITRYVDSLLLSG
jgi:hypothetical protein